MIGYRNFLFAKSCSNKNINFMAFGVVFSCILMAGSMNIAHAEQSVAQKPADVAAIAQESKTSSELVNKIGTEALRLLGDKTISKEARDARFRDILRNSFDLTTMGRYVIGRSWASANPEQRQEYMKLFEELVVKIYSDRISLYSNEGFRILGERAESGKDSVVNSEITHSDGSKPIQVDWRVRKNNDGKLSIIDIIIEGVSMSVTQRQEYSSLIQRNGGDIEALLVIMRQRYAADESKRTTG